MSATPSYLVSLEWCSSVKEFFDKFSNIPVDELYTLWRNKFRCRQCDSDIISFRNCNHRKSIGNDYPDMIIVLEWNFNGQIILDVSSWTSFYHLPKSQCGYIYHNNVPIMENLGMCLYPVQKTLDKENLIIFRRFRDAAFGYYVSYNDDGSKFRRLAFSDWEDEAEFVKFPQWMLDIRKTYIYLDKILRESYRKYCASNPTPLSEMDLSYDMCIMSRYGHTDTPTDLPLIGYECYHTIKQFFETYPEISTEPLLKKWCVNCSECEDIRQCEHDHQIDPIVVLKWDIGCFDLSYGGEANDVFNLNGQRSVALDIYSEPSHIHQIGCIYYNNWPVIDNVNMDLTIVVNTFDYFDFETFSALRLAAFGYISKNMKGVDDEYRVIKVSFEDYGSEIPKDLRNINEQMKRLMQPVTN